MHIRLVLSSFKLEYRVPDIIFKNIHLVYIPRTFTHWPGRERKIVFLIVPGNLTHRLELFADVTRLVISRYLL